MRKVFFQFVIPAQYDGPDGGTKTLVKGTGCFSEMESGLFHCFGQCSDEHNGEVTNDTIALIEHINTGIVHQVAVGRFRFVTPPETRAHKNEGNELVNVLLEVVKKLDAIACKIEGA